MKNFRFNKTENRQTIGVTTRQIVLSVCFIVFTCACFAQDIIVTRDSKRIEAKVTEINVDVVRYKQFDNQDGPVYSLPKNDILTIVYQNGQVETFELATATPNERNQTTFASTQTTQTPTQTTQAPYQSTTRRLSTAETLSIMQTNYPALYSQYNSGRRLKSTGWALTGIGIGTFVLGVALGTDGSENGNIEQEDAGVVITAAGIILVATGIPILAVGAGKRRRALNAFNNQYYSYDQPTPQFQLNLYPNGMGLAYVF